ncbi:MAG: ester cyclase [Actinobacteria bacterium]|nr:ester cyclase [Actinomycetota bacterium]
MRHDQYEWIIEGWARAWNVGDVAALDRVFAPEYVRHEGNGGSIGLDELKLRIQALRHAFPGVVAVVDDIFGQDDRLAIRWTSTGTHEREYLGVPGTGRKIVVNGISIASIRARRIVEEWVTWDPREMLAALDIITVTAR